MGVTSAGPAGDGYWRVTDGGVVASLREAPDDPLPPHYGEICPSCMLNAPIVGIAGQPAGGGYRLVGADGGVFTFGNAGFFGSLAGIPLNSPVVAMAVPPSGGGYWLVARDGGIFAFNVPFLGGLGGQGYNDVVGMAATPSGNGYWLVRANGAIYSFGDAGYYGGSPGVTNIVGMARTSNGGGYWLLGAQGAVYTYGNAGWHGNGSNCCGFPFASIVAERGLHLGYRMQSRNDTNFPGFEPNQSPIGWVDENTYVRVRGWALDPNTTTRSITVQIKVDNVVRYQQATPLASGDVNAAYNGISGNHRFDWNIAANAPDLLNAQPHTVQVWALDSAGDPSKNVLLNQTTWTSPVQPPGTPQNVVASGVSDGSATVTWTPPNSTGGGSIDQYAVNVFFASNGAWTGQQVVVCGTCTSAVVTGLALDVGYYFGAYAHTSAGYGVPGYSNTITIPNVGPVGVVEEATGSRIIGWVHDPNNRAQPLTVKIYLDGAATPTATVMANISRPKSNPPATDGFEWVVPSQYRDGEDHRVRVEALDATTGAPLTITEPTLSFAQLAETWTGANTSPWDTSKWITSVGTGGGVQSAVTIAGNQGRLYVKGGDAMAIAQNLTGTIAPTRDADVSYTYRFDSRTASSTFRTVLRGSGAWPLGSGYRLNVTSDTSTITLERVSAGLPVSLASFTYTKTTTTQRVRFRLDGARLRVKVWLATDPEPIDWQIDISDTAPLPGSGLLQFHHSVSKGSRSVFIDDLVVIRRKPTINEQRPSSAPGFSISRYMNVNPDSDFTRMGEDEGRRVQPAPVGSGPYDPLIILGFGAQSSTGATGYGSQGFSEQQLVDASVNFINGYSSTNPGHELVLAVGTTNDLYALNAPDGGESDAKAKGAAWARVVNQVWDRVNVAHPNMVVAGANDFEAGAFSPSLGRETFGGPAPKGPRNAKAWVSGWTSPTNTNGLQYINYGSTDGCPTSGSGPNPGQCDRGWTQDDYWFLSQGTLGAVAGSLPQVYNTNHQQLREREISKYGFYAYADFGNRGTINFLGALTQHLACQTRNCHATTQAQPWEAWSAFRQALDDDGSGTPPPTKGESLGFASDIGWQGDCKQTETPPVGLGCSQ